MSVSLATYRQGRCLPSAIIKQGQNFKQDAAAIDLIQDFYVLDLLGLFCILKTSLPLTQVHTHTLVH